ncbi:hypothetical protein SAMN05421755_101523 [Nitrosomonas sp. Nm33]|nr:hypothetical protein SAMN05421755_101523 [Nitrosomonas sp. Nm33]
MKQSATRLFTLMKVDLPIMYRARMDMLTWSKDTTAFWTGMPKSGQSDQCADRRVLSYHQIVQDVHQCRCFLRVEFARPVAQTFSGLRYRDGQCCFPQATGYSGYHRQSRARARIFARLLPGPQPHRTQMGSTKSPAQKISMLHREPLQ